jgi:protein-tyrosine phosphatase
VSEPRRDVELVDVYNLRDLGGYPTGDGRRVRWRRLYRGAGLQRLAGADLDAVRALGLTTVIDLRTGGELRATGACPADVLSAAFHHLPMIDRTWDPADLDPAISPERVLLDRYREMLDEGAPTIRAAVELLSAQDGLPGVFYCAAGKDRTGVLAALVLDAIGVQAESIIADYHLSKERVQRILARARRAERTSTMVAQPTPYMQAPTGAMALLLEWIREAHGSSATYLRTIGVPAAALGALGDALLEPAPAA